MAISAAARLEARRALEPLPLLEGVQDDGTINKTLLDYVWRKPGKGWLLLIGLGLAGTGLLTFAVVLTVAKGIGMWGNNIDRKSTRLNSSHSSSSYAVFCLK